MDLLIENIEMHVPLSPADEIIIRKLIHKKIIPKGEHLLQAGQVCRHVTFIEQGLVRYYLFTNGEE